MVGWRLFPVSDRRGVRDFAWQDPGEASFRRYVHHMNERGVRTAAVSFDYLRARLRETEQLNEGSGEGLPLNYRALRDWLEVDAVPGEVDSHPARSVESMIEVQEPPSPEEIRGLLELQETGDWMLPPDAFASHDSELREVGKSRLVLEGLRPEERLRRIVGQALEEHMAGGEGRLWSLRLLDLAHVLNQSDRTRSGRTAALVARDLESVQRSPIAEAFLWALGARTLGLVQTTKHGAEGGWRGWSG